MDDDDNRLIECIGVDQKRHVCLVDSDTCLCGVLVLRKKIMRDDYKRFSCYPCTY